MLLGLIENPVLHASYAHTVMDSFSYISLHILDTIFSDQCK